MCVATQGRVSFSLFWALGKTYDTENLLMKFKRVKAFLLIFFFFWWWVGEGIFVLKASKEIEKDPKRRI